MGRTTAGELVNLLSNDVVRFDFAMPFLHFIWIMPFLGLGGLVVMYSYIGLAALPTMAVMTVQAIFGQGTLYIQCPEIVRPTVTEGSSTDKIIG